MSALEGMFTTRRYTNPRLPYLYLTFVFMFSCVFLRISLSRY